MNAPWRGCVSRLLRWRGRGRTAAWAAALREANHPGTLQRTGTAPARPWWCGLETTGGEKRHESCCLPRLNTRSDASFSLELANMVNTLMCSLDAQYGFLLKWDELLFLWLNIYSCNGSPETKQAVTRPTCNLPHYYYWSWFVSCHKVLSHYRLNYYYIVITLLFLIITKKLSYYELISSNSQVFSFFPTWANRHKKQP